MVSIDPRADARSNRCFVLDSGLAPPALAALALVVLTAFTVETALGFGATLITVALGSIFLPIDALLPAIVPLNLSLSVWLTVRYRREVDTRFLFRRLLPLMLIGMPLGILVFRHADPSLLRRIFGVFLVIVSGIEIARMRHAHAVAVAPIPRAVEIGMLLAGGMVHGAFATGGPMAVYVVGRTIADKGRYRATLCLLWAILNTFLLLTYLRLGDLDGASLSITAWLAPSCALGLWAGELAHHRVPAATFRGLVFVGLALVGATLIVRG